MSKFVYSFYCWSDLVSMCESKELALVLIGFCLFFVPYPRMCITNGKSSINARHQSDYATNTTKTSSIHCLPISLLGLSCVNIINHRQFFNWNKIYVKLKSTNLQKLLSYITYCHSNGVKDLRLFCFWKLVIRTFEEYRFGFFIYAWRVCYVFGTHELELLCSETWQNFMRS